MSEHEYQARAFLEWFRRGNVDWESAFVYWSVSKDFTPDVARRIRRVVHAELFARADVVATDPMEVLT